jgi:hypothetical protein
MVFSSIGKQEKGDLAMDCLFPHYWKRDPCRTFARNWIITGSYLDEHNDRWAGRIKCQMRNDLYKSEHMISAEGMEKVGLIMP